jgi:preprotein translocase subunit SecA
VEYDDVMNKHREIIYARRRKILKSANIKDEMLVLFSEEAKHIVMLHTSSPQLEDWNYQEIIETINAIHKDAKNPLTLEDIETIIDREELIGKISDFLKKEYEEKSLEDPESMREVERNVYFRVIDSLWMDHIDEMSHLRESVALSGYGQRDPLIEYKSQAFEKFTLMLASIRTNTVNTLFKVNIVKEAARNLLQKAIQSMRTNEEDVEKVLSGENAIRRMTPIPGMEVQDSESSKSPTVIRVKADENESSAKNLRRYRGIIASTSPVQPQTSQQTTSSQATISKNQTGKNVGRNDSCPCGSEKKFKKCCGQ